MIWNSLDFIIHEAALQLRRERLIGVATISTVAVLMTLLGAVILFLIALHLSTGHMLGELEIWACFEEELPREQAVAQGEEMAGWKEISSSKFVPKEEGLPWLQRQMPSSTALKKYLGNPLPDAIRVKVKEARFLVPVAERLDRTENIASVVSSNDIFQKALRIKRGITWGVVMASILVGLAGVFITHNTVWLSLHARWREIYIMQLVGASRGITAAPFLLEGAAHGALGAILAACVLLPTHMYLYGLTAGPVGSIVLAPNRLLVHFGLGLLLSGVLLGIAGSALSIRRYLGQRREWEG